jgi:hypothetical protein
MPSYDLVGKQLGQLSPVARLGNDKTIFLNDPTEFYQIDKQLGIRCMDSEGLLLNVYIDLWILYSKKNLHFSNRYICQPFLQPVAPLFVFLEIPESSPKQRKIHWHADTALSNQGILDWLHRNGRIPPALL